MSLIEVKKCEFDTVHIHKTICSECGHEAEGLLDTCPECGSVLVKHAYSIPQYTLQEDLDTVFVNKDHIVKAKKLKGYSENYYLISFTNSGTLIVDETDFNSLK